MYKQLNQSKVNAYIYIYKINEYIYIYVYIYKMNIYIYIYIGVYIYNALYKFAKINRAETMPRRCADPNTYE